MNLAKVLPVVTVILIAFALFLPASIKADTVRMKNGQVLTGQIVAQTRTSVTIRTSGGMRVVQKAQIASIQYGAVESPEEKRRKELERQRKIEEARKERERIEREKREQEEAEKAAKEAEEQRKREQELERKRQEEERIRQELANRPTTWGATWRSMILPGWGQHYRGDTTQGWVTMGAYSLLGLAALYNENELKVAQSKFEMEWEDFSSVYFASILISFNAPVDLIFISRYSGIESDPNYQKAQAAQGRRPVLIGTVAAIWAYTLFDSLYFTNSENVSFDLQIFDERQPGFASSPQMGMNYQATVTWRF